MATDPDLLQTAFRWTQSAVCEPIDEGAVLLHLETGEYFELNPTALRAWREWDRPRAGTDVAATLAAEFEVTPECATADLAVFITSLVQAGFLERAPGAAP